MAAGRQQHSQKEGPGRRQQAGLTIHTGLGHSGGAAAQGVKHLLLKITLLRQNSSSCHLPSDKIVHQL